MSAKSIFKGRESFAERVAQSDLPAKIKARFQQPTYTNGPDTEKPFKFEGPAKSDEVVQWVPPFLRKLRNRPKKKKAS